MRLTDDQWTAAARAQLARSGEWHIPFAVAQPKPVSPAAETTGPRCPACDAHPPLAEFPRREAVGLDPLRYCLACYGFWVVGDALAHGVADSGDGHEALFAALGPRRCRSCLGHLKPDGVCAKCHRARPRLPCPGCGKEMERFEKSGVWLDACAPCRGTWFDIGEVARVYGLTRPQSLAASQVDETAAPGDGEIAMTALGILLRIFVPFLR